MNSHLNLFGNASTSPRQETGSFNANGAALSNSSVGNLSASGYGSLNNSRNSSIKKLDLNFQTRSDPGIDTHRNAAPSRLVNSSRGPDSSRGQDSARSFEQSFSRSNSREDELERCYSRQGPTFDEIQTPFKPASLTKSNSSSLTKSTSGSLEREGSGHSLKISGKGTNRRAQELKRDLLEVCYFLHLYQPQKII